MQVIIYSTDSDSAPLREIIPLHLSSFATLREIFSAPLQPYLMQAIMCSTKSDFES